MVESWLGKIYIKKYNCDCGKQQHIISCRISPFSLVSLKKNISKIMTDKSLHINVVCDIR